MASLERAIMQDAYKWLNNISRNAAKEIMNGLAEAGPEWSGDFKNSWVAISPSGGTGSGTYPYTLADIPELPLTLREAQRETKFIIDNLAPHKLIAMDLISVPREEFVYPGYPPKGDIVDRGKRPETGKRGDVGEGRGNARSTAPLDWYTTFAKGGMMQKVLERGVRLAK